METRPPEIIERIVGWFVPAPSREHVLGDLSERYISPRQYVLDAIRALPFVIASRVRRTANPALGVIILVLLLIPGTASFLEESPKNLLVPILPAFIGTLALMLRDAYRGQVRHWLRAAAGDILAVALSIVGLQGLLAITLPQLLVPRGVLLGYPVILLLLFLVRWQVGSFLQARPSASNLSLQELTTEIRDFEANVRRAVRLELSACAVMIPILAAASWYETSPVGKTGYGLTAAGVAFVGWFLLRYGRIRAMAAELGFEETVQAYRYHLQKSMKFSSTYHWWYLLPLSIGPMVLTIGTSGIGIWMLAPIGIWIMFAGLLLLWQKQYRDRTRRRLDELAIATEKSSQ